MAILKKASETAKKHGLIGGFAIFLAVVSFSSPEFLTPGNILDVIRQV